MIVGFLLDTVFMQFLSEYKNYAARIKKIIMKITCQLRFFIYHAIEKNETIK